MILNEARGRDAVGFFNAHGAYWKCASRATVELRDKRCTRWIEDSCKKSWAVCGHTRAGTRGGATTRNAHPFTYGQVVGSHNGTIPDAPKEYPVDTEWAIDLLSKSGPGGYQQALGEVSGWYALTWYDKREKAVYLLNWEGTLNLTWYRGVWYYSSEADHLRTAIGAETKIASIGHGKVVRFHFDKKEGLKWQNMPDFTGKLRWVKTQQTDYTNYNRGHSNYEPNPRILGPVHSTRQRLTIADPLLPSGFVGRFPGGLWHAHILNNTYRLLTCQQELNDKHKDSKPGMWEWMRPGEIRSKMAGITPATPPVPLPVGLKAPPDLSEGTKVLATTIIPEVEKKSEPSTATSFPPEEEQERADLEAAKASSMDKDGTAVEEVVKLQQERFSLLTDEYYLTPDEATRVMTSEGYFAPGAFSK